MSKARKNPPLTREQEQIASNRKVLLWGHAVAAFFSTLVYLSRINFSRSYYEYSLGSLVLLSAAPALVPYALSAVHARPLVTYRRVDVWLFLGVLLAGAVLMDLLIGGAFAIDMHGLNLICALGAQTWLYLGTAQLLFRVV